MGRGVKRLFTKAKRPLLTIHRVDHGVRGDVLHHVKVLQLSLLLLLEQHGLLVLQLLHPVGLVGLPRAVSELPEQMRDQADDLPVAVGRLRVGERRQRGRGLEAGPFGLHLGRLPPLRLGELSRDDNQAQVDHEKRANLELKIQIDYSFSENFIAFPYSPQ